MTDKEKEYGKKFAQLQSVENFRDLGGIALSNGRTVKDGRFFRCGALSGLGEQAQSALNKLEIDRIMDFRSGVEATLAPDYVPSLAVYEHLPVLDEDSFSLLKKTDFRLDKIVSSLSREMLAKYYLKFVGTYSQMPYATHAYSHIFEAMDKGQTILFHCSAGKDRTGVASMLILLALGADFKSVEEDYLLTNLYRKQVVDNMLKQVAIFNFPKEVNDMLVAIMTAQPQYIQSSMQSILSKYPSVDEFFLNEYGIDAERRKRYVELYTE